MSLLLLYRPSAAGGAAPVARDIVRIARVLTYAKPATVTTLRRQATVETYTRIATYTHVET